MECMNLLVSWPIRKKLCFLLLIIFLAAVGIILAVGFRQRAEDIQKAQNSAMLIAQGMAAQQEQMAMATRTMLTMLAQFPEVQHGDAAKSSSLFERLNNQYPFYTVILAVGAEGHVFAASRPFDRSTNLSDRKHVKDAIRTRDFSVGEYIVGRVSNSVSINYTYPVLDAKGDVKLVLIAAFDLGQFSRFVSDVHLLKDSSVSIVDWKGARLFRVPADPITPLGSRLGSFDAISGESRDGFFTRKSADGIRRVYAYRQIRLRDSDPAYLYLVIGIPRYQIIRAADTRMTWNLLLLGIAAALATAFARSFGDYLLVRPIGRLVESARRLGKGELTARTGLPHTQDEVGRLAQAFDDMSALLENKNNERNRAETALRRSEERFALAVRATKDLLWDWNVATGTFWRSESYWRHFGYEPPDKEPGLHEWLELIHPDDRERVRQQLEDAQRNQLRNAGELECRYRRADGTYATCVNRASFVYDDSGRLIRSVGAVRDISDSLHIMEQLRQAQKLEAIGQLAAGIAHEINTPTQFIGDNIQFIRQSWGGLHAVLALARLMREEAAVAPLHEQLLADFDREVETSDLEYILDEVPRAIDHSLEGVRRVAKIVQAMKEFSHRGTEEKSPVDINRAISATVTVARNEWKYVADLEMALDPELPLVPCFVAEFNQVMLNLLVNASHSIADKVGDGAQGKGVIRIATTRNGSWIEASVRDNGLGIPEAIQPRIFEPFFTTKPIGKGTGQGLAMAHSVIVKRHGGKLWCESQPGEGSTFFIRLPLAA